MAEGYQSLYRRYRPRRFSEVRGQDHVVRALRNAVREGRVGHAYLFSGPRGTGKTTSARLLAKVLNCAAPVDGEPCGTCDACAAVESGRMVDWLQEHDAASNNRVEPMRDLLEKVPLGTSGNRKVIILDEVHMLTGGAANALLKTLEEPPDHVVFVLATTDPQKVLPTIRSRTQHLEFHLLPADELAEHVRWVVQDAGLDLGEDAVEHALRLGGGSARDTLSALDQIAAVGGVVADDEPVDAILTAVGDRDPGAVLVAVADAVAAGRDVRVLGAAVIERLRNAFLAVMGAPDRHLPEGERVRAEALGTAMGAPGLTRALEVVGEALVDLPKKTDPRIVLEVALVRLTRPDVDRGLDALLERVDRLERAASGGAPVSPSPAPPPTPGAATPPGPTTAPGAAGPAAEARAELARRGAGPVPGAAKKAAAPRAPAPPREALGPDAGPGPGPDPGPGAGPDPGPGAVPGPATGPPPAAPAPQDRPDRPAAAAPAAPSPSPAPPSPAGAAPGAPPALPTRDELTLAWGDHILDGLPGAAKALYRMGRFVDGDGRAATFALPNAPHRDHCEKQRAAVEAALARHFDRPVPLLLVTDAEVGGPGAGADLAPAPRSAGPGPDAVNPSPPDDEDVGDVADLEDAPDTGSGLDRLTEAFPGAELIEE
jgi:DNA polymerase III subunit gamma/tau